MLLATKFFYDHFTADEICGMYTVGHFCSMAAFAVLLVAALWCSRKLTERQLDKLHWIIAIATVCLEAVKITLRVIKGQGADDWMPLYYCSLFMFAIWAAKSKNTVLQRTGYAYITMGGVLAALAFTVYPSTSLALFPIWHPSSFHSFIYHWTMCYTGLLFLLKKRYTPTVKDSIFYTAFILLACIPSYFLNEWLGTNCMFLHYAFKLPVLDQLLAFSHPLYMAVVILAQAVGMYWLNFGLYRLAVCLKNNKEKRK
ncbi:MAG: YwaF family protein [Clostridia bacterium]|nr:YwaF family protein [Clostridia bacterium]